MERRRGAAAGRLSLRSGGFPRLPYAPHARLRRRRLLLPPPPPLNGGLSRRSLGRDGNRAIIQIFAPRTKKFSIYKPFLCIKYIFGTHGEKELLMKNNLDGREKERYKEPVMAR